MRFQRFPVRGEEDDIVGIAGIDDPGLVEMPVHFHQIDVRQERGGRRAGHDAVLLMDDGSVDKRPVVRQHPFEKSIQGRVIRQQILEERKEDGDGDGIEIIVDVQFVRPHLLSAKRLPEPEDGIAGLDAPAEGIAVGGESVVVAVQEECDEFENAGLIGAETVDCPFLSRPHLVDAFLLRNAGTLSVHETVRHRQIAFVPNPVVRIAEQGPGETPFQQAVGQEFFPGRLVIQL